jgi:Holliday junction resolvase YEN1
MARHVIRLFGFTVHDAPGEAEAECALLQQQGIVDAVLSEDVDTIMFGCTRTLRNWSSDTRGNKTPTHVSVYDAAEIGQSESGLEREGMVLVALMSGGDYIPEGVPGCGIKVACEAAKAGFGRSLCRIKKSDKDGLAEWKDKLMHELQTNESGYFRTRHKALAIPESFPNMEVLRYYTHPVVSQQAALDKLRAEFPSKTPVDVPGLREFVRDTFDWTYKIGAIKLIRVLAPSLLVQDLLETRSRAESTLVKGLSNRRCHISTDGTPELRVSYIPSDIVKLDLEAEPEEVAVPYGRGGLALNSDDDFEDETAELEESSKTGAAKKVFDPLQQDLIWIPELVVKQGAAEAMKEWEERQRSKEQGLAAKAAKKASKKKNDMPAGALDKWVRTSKPGSQIASPTKLPNTSAVSRLPPPLTSQQSTSTTTRKLRPTGPSKKPSTSSKTSSLPQPGSSQTMSHNPWTIAGSHISPRVTKSISGSPSRPREQIIISSSPLADTTSPTTVPTVKTPSKRGKPGSSPERDYKDASPSRARSQPSRQALDNSRSRQQGPRKTARGLGKEKPTSQMSITAYGKIYEGRSKSQQDAPGKGRGIDDPFVIESDEDEPKACIPAAGPAEPAVEIASTGADQSCNGNINSSGSPSRRKDETHLGGGAEDESIVSIPPSGPVSTPSTSTGGNFSLGDSPWEEEIRLRGGELRTTKLYIPRVSDVGFFREVEVTIDEAERIRGEAGTGSTRLAILRRSDISIVDLTGKD